jgi:hypothetical protein
VLCFVLFRSSPLMTFRNLHVNFYETVEELFCLWTTAITWPVHINMTWQKFKRCKKKIIITRN